MSNDEEQKAPEPIYVGWFGLCPVYVADAFSDCPTVWERHWSLMPWFWLNHQLMGAAIFVATMIWPEFEPWWPIRITGKYRGAAKRPH